MKKIIHLFLIFISNRFQRTDNHFKSDIFQVGLGLLSFWPAALKLTIFECARSKGMRNLGTNQSGITENLNHDIMVIYVDE